MSTKNKAVVQRFLDEFVNAHDLTRLDEVIVVDDVVEVVPIVVDAPSGGLDAFRQGWQLMLDSFPDIHVTAAPRQAS